MNNERTKKKTPVVFYISLVLLCLCMLTSHMTGGLYARYSTTVTGTASAQVANIDVYIDYKFMGHTLDIKMQSVTEEYYAVIEEFTVENNGEVAYDYTLNLKLAKDVNSAEYDNPDDSPEYDIKDNFSISAMTTTIKSNIYDEEKITAGIVANEPTSFAVGNAYYAYSLDGTNYTWANKSAGDILTINSPATLAIGAKHHYGIMYFVKIDANLASGEQLRSPQIALLYQITCEQVD